MACFLYHSLFLYLDPRIPSQAAGRSFWKNGFLKLYIGQSNFTASLPPLYSTCDLTPLECVVAALLPLNSTCDLIPLKYVVAVRLPLNSTCDLTPLGYVAATISLSTLPVIKLHWNMWLQPASLSTLLVI